MAFTLLRTFDVTIPAGTPKTAPIAVSTAFSQATVERIDWLFPVGCNGVVGIQIGSRNVNVLPAASDHFFIRSGDSAGFDLEDMPNTGDWSVIGYNTGSFDHTIHVTFRLRKGNDHRDLTFITDGNIAAIGVGEG